MHEPTRPDRRATLKWVLAVASGLPLLEAGVAHVLPSASGTNGEGAIASDALPSSRLKVAGYGLDPNLLADYRPGELWPLTLRDDERRTARALCDLVIPADETSPSASSLGVVDFLDEWISAPYPTQLEDRVLLLEGLVWIDAESHRRFGRTFAELREPEQRSICDPISYAATAPPQLKRAAQCFARFRDLTATGFYTTPEGRRDLNFVGNMPSTRFDGPPADVLRRVGLSDVGP